LGHEIGEKAVCFQQVSGYVNCVCAVLSTYLFVLHVGLAKEHLITKILVIKI